MFKSVSRSVAAFLRDRFSRPITQGALFSVVYTMVKHDHDLSVLQRLLLGTLTLALMLLLVEACCLIWDGLRTLWHLLGSLVGSLVASLLILLLWVWHLPLV